MTKMTAKTNNGDMAYEHSKDLFVEFFSKAGSLFEKKGTFYGNEATALELFKPCWYADKEISFRLLCWLRDCRVGSSGAGNRSGFRLILNWIATQDPEWVVSNIALIPKYGRWDDLLSLYGTDCERFALCLWSESIKAKDGLACKWADRKDNKLRSYMKITPKEYRKMVVNGTNVVEQKICANDWDRVDYETVPSKAMSMYAKAFEKHDSLRFLGFKGDVAKGEKKINSSALFPHDCVRSVKSGDSQIGLLQFNNLPNYVTDKNTRTIVMCDFSYSMQTNVSGSVEAIDISLAMGLYFSSRLDKSNPFYKKFLSFSTNPCLADWSKYEFDYAVKNYHSICEIGMSTDVEKALKAIVKFANTNSIGKELVPNSIIIVSDTQFNQATQNDCNAVEAGLREFDKYGYERPKIIHWNVAGYAGQPATAHMKNVGMVSGFSPGILQSIFANEDFTPYSIMLKAIEKYVVSVPTCGIVTHCQLPAPKGAGL